jgi:hypothetical protein
MTSSDEKRLRRVGWSTQASYQKVPMAPIVTLGSVITPVVLYIEKTQLPFRSVKRLFVHRQVDYCSGEDREIQMGRGYSMWQELTMLFTCFALHMLCKNWIGILYNYHTIPFIFRTYLIYRKEWGIDLSHICTYKSLLKDTQDENCVLHTTWIIRTLFEQGCMLLATRHNMTLQYGLRNLL